MSGKLDYSKFDNIEISDDEDDTHPNIDNACLFSLRHRIRVERMEKDQKEKEEFEKKKNDHKQKITYIRSKIRESEQGDQTCSDELSKLELELSYLKIHEDELIAKEEELKEKEKLTPLNIDTICKDGKSRTMINKIEPRKEESLTDDEKLERQEKFKKENESLMKKFAMFKKFDDSHQFLLKHPHLTCKETLNYLTIWCINLEVEGKKELMNHVAHQIIVMQFIMTIAHEADPRNFISAFFWRIKSEDELHINIFNEELEAFKQRVRTRAQLKIEEDLVEKEERQKRLGPGGLDPVEVFDSLPGILKECFEKKDMAMLMKAVRTLTREESEYHMLRCIASGLWIPDEEEGENVNARTDSDDRENIYKGA